MELEYDKIQKAAYSAFLRAAMMTGDAYKNLSWFPRNKAEHEQSAKEAA